MLTKQLPFRLALAALPPLFLAAKAPPEALDLVKQILEEFYTDGIETVISAELNSDGDIEGEFVDRVGLRQVKRYRYLIKDDQVDYSLVNPNEVQGFSFEVYAPAKKKSCKKGTPCGGTCISAGKNCRKKASTAGKSKIAAAKKALGGSGKPASGKKTASSGGGSLTPDAPTLGSAILALPPAGETSAPENKKNGPPLSINEIKQAVYKEFGVSNLAGLKKSGKFRMATNARKDINFSSTEQWKQLHRNHVGVLPDERFTSNASSINGVDVLKYNRPWQVFGVDPKSSKYQPAKGLKGKAKKADQQAKDKLLNSDVKKAFNSLAVKYHPDTGNTPNREVFQKLVTWKDSLTATF
ncbi:MAG TPA: hypothetical protein V6D19_11405 [Stenomitos sp.]